MRVAIDSAYTNVVTGLSVLFIAQNSNPITATVWDFGDGVVVSNRCYASHAWAVPGLYEVRLTGYNDSFPGGVTATVLVRVAGQEVYYVNAANLSPVFPYTNWAGAGTNIQEAIDAGTQVGRLVRVTNGFYASGGRAVCGTMTNRVVIPDGVEVRSESGPLVTIIAGQAAPGDTSNGDGAVRCVYVGSDAVLSGFTLTNGHTRSNGNESKELSGGGAWCEASGLVANCTSDRQFGTLVRRRGLLGHAEELHFEQQFGKSFWRRGIWLHGEQVHLAKKLGGVHSGGGACNSALSDCTLIGNISSTYGGGIAGGVLYDSRITGNSARSGGGASEALLNNCTLMGNAADTGGGAHSSGLNNCILTANSAKKAGGGVWESALTNCYLRVIRPISLEAARTLASSTTASFTITEPTIITALMLPILAPHRNREGWATSPTLLCSWTRTGGAICGCNPTPPVSMRATTLRLQEIRTWMAGHASLVRLWIWGRSSIRARG